jgi:hypothetical protein
MGIGFAADPTPGVDPAPPAADPEPDRSAPADPATPPADDPTELTPPVQFGPPAPPPKK